MNIEVDAKNGLQVISLIYLELLLFCVFFKGVAPRVANIAHTLSLQVGAPPVSIEMFFVAMVTRVTGDESLSMC